MNNNINTLELLSITAAARRLAIGKDTMYNLISEGKIGYIEIGKRKKITYAELIRFQNENTKKQQPIIPDKTITAKDVEHIFQLDNRSTKKTLYGEIILSQLMR
jgi:excisionase family DNA binding protein